MAQNVTFDPIDFNQKTSLNYKSRIHAGKDGDYLINVLEETGWIYQKYSGFAPKKFNTPDKRDFMKIEFNPEQLSTMELKERVVYYDTLYNNNKKNIFADYHTLYTIIPSVKKPQEINELELKLQGNTNASTSQKLENSKWKLDTMWNYYYNNERLNKKNTDIVRKRITEEFKAKKTNDKEILKTLAFSLNFMEDENEVTKIISYNDLETRK